MPEGRIYEEIPENFVQIMDNREILNVCESNFEKLLGNTKLEEGTPWEQEARIRRIYWDIFQRNNVIEQMSASIDTFDAKLNELVSKEYCLRFSIIKACISKSL